MLVKSADGHVRFIQATGATIGEAIDVGELKGYHLVTVRCDADGGASVQIDNGEPVANDALRLLPNNNGIQFGTCLGGLPEGFAVADNFMICKVLGFDTTIIPQYAELCAAHPVITTMPSFTYDVAGGVLHLPCLAWPEAARTSTVTRGTLRIQNGMARRLKRRLMRAP